MRPVRPGFPLFVHAWFRSGSTYVWSKLRNSENLICYYEPFHEVLGEQSLSKQIESHRPIEASLSLRHPVQDHHYFYEYRGLLGADDLNFVPELSYQDYFLLQDQADNPRSRYIQTLISHAKELDRLPALCFCRSQMRSAWIRKNFMGSHIAQIRDPLSQWESFSVLPYFRNTMVKIALDLRRSHAACFYHIPNFNRFAAAFETRKGLPADQLYEFFLKPDDFLAIFLVIWILSTLQSVSHCDLTLDIDRLSSDESYRAFVQEWFRALGCDVDFSDCSINSTSKINVEKASDMIIEAGQAVKQSACVMLICNAAKVGEALTFMSDRSRKAIDLFLISSGTK